MIESKEQYEAFIKLNDMGKGARQGHYGWEAHLTIEALREVARASKKREAAMVALGKWVHENMENEPSVRLIRSIDIFRELKGSRDEYTKLFTALARSIGIRTQINTGLVYDGGVFRYHSWPTVFVDDFWYDLDPYYGQDNADATHIALILGDYEKLVELLRIIGQVSVTIHDYR